MRNFTRPSSRLSVLLACAPQPRASHAGPQPTWCRSGRGEGVVVVNLLAVSSPRPAQACSLPNMAVCHVVVLWPELLVPSTHTLSHRLRVRAVRPDSLLTMSARTPVVSAPGTRERGSACCACSSSCDVDAWLCSKNAHPSRVRDRRRLRNRRLLIEGIEPKSRWTRCALALERGLVGVHGEEEAHVPSHSLALAVAGLGRLTRWRLSRWRLTRRQLSRWWLSRWQL